MWKEDVLALFKLLSWNLPGYAEEKSIKPLLHTLCTSRNRTREHPQRSEALPLRRTWSVVSYVSATVSRLCSAFLLVNRCWRKWAGNVRMRVIDVNQYQPCSFFPWPDFIYRMFHKAWVILPAYIQGVKMVKVDTQVTSESWANDLICFLNTKRILMTIMMMLIIIQFSSGVIINVLSQ
jgi:hypothetical protein